MSMSHLLLLLLLLSTCSSVPVGSLYGYGYEECPDLVDKTLHEPLTLETICGDAHCPRTVDQASKGCYNSRKIIRGKWVKVDMNITLPDLGFRDGAAKLMGYFYGANNDGTVIPLTVPILNRWYLDRNLNVAGGKMYFYIPPKYHKNTPSPSDKSLKVVRFASSVLYSRALGSNVIDMTMSEIQGQFHTLTKVLTENKIQFYPYQAITSSYTAPGETGQRVEFMLLDWS